MTSFIVLLISFIKYNLAVSNKSFTKVLLMTLRTNLKRMLYTFHKQLLISLISFSSISNVIGFLSFISENFNSTTSFKSKR